MLLGAFPAARAQTSLSIPDYSFEAVSVGGGNFQYGPVAGAPWTFAGSASGASGIAANGSGFTQNNPPAPEGAQVGFVQEAGVISQPVPGFRAGVNYILTVAAARRLYYLANAVSVQLDGVTLGTITQSSSGYDNTAYQDYTFGPFTTTAGTHTLTFTGLNPSNTDCTMFLDNVRISGTSSAPSAPTGLQASARNNNVMLTWSPSVGATSYNVYRSTVTGGPYTLISFAGAVSGTHYTDLNLVSGTTYYYVVTAVNSGGESGRSVEVIAVPTSIQSGSPPTDDAVFVSQSVPTYMTAGQTYNVSVTMQNGGFSTWPTGGNYQLVSQNAAGNTTWNPSPDGSGGNHNSVAPNVAVAPNAQVTFAFTVTAPTTPGTYDFQWQMANEGAGAYQYFGGPTDDVTVTVAAPTATRLTPAQAIQIAQDFCASNSNPISVLGNAQYVVPDEDDAYWQPRWTITFDNQATVEVVDATGVVASYTNNAYAIQIMKLQGQPAGSLIAQATALQTASAALQTTASTEQTASPSAYMSQDNDGLLTGEASWHLQYNRQYQGIPYKDDFAVVQIDAATNQLIGMSLTYRCAPPDNGGSAAVVTQGQAEAVAQAQLDQAVIQGATLQSDSMQIVLPNTYWQDGGYNFTPGQGKVAWIVTYSVGDPTTGAKYGIWVDAATGNVIGGEYIGEERGMHTKHTARSGHRKKKLAKSATHEKLKQHTAAKKATKPIR